MDWVESFAYPPGPLTGNADWVDFLTGSGAVDATGVFTTDTGNSSNSTPVPGFESSNPWRLTLTFTPDSGVEAGTSPSWQNMLGTTGGPTILEVDVDFGSGLLGVDQIGLFDGAGGATTDIGILTRDVEHTIVVEFDGTNLVATVDGGIPITQPVTPGAGPEFSAIWGQMDGLHIRRLEIQQPL